jgi:hypothetical protein
MEPIPLSEGQAAANAELESVDEIVERLLT